MLKIIRCMESHERKTSPSAGKPISAAMVGAILLCGGFHRWLSEGSVTARRSAGTITSYGLLSDWLERAAARGAAATLDGAEATYTKHILNNILFGDDRPVKATHYDNSTVEEEEEPPDEPPSPTSDPSEDDDRPLRGATTFKKGDVVEVIHNRILAPFQVTAAHSLSDDGHVDHYDGDSEQIIADYENTIGYDLVRASDGFKIIHMPESSLRHYQPYEAGTKALCNLGEVGALTLEPCRVEDYSTITTGSTVLENEYRVLVLDGEKEYEASLPVSRLQRRNNHDT